MEHKRKACNDAECGKVHDHGHGMFFVVEISQEGIADSVAYSSQ